MGQFMRLFTILVFFLQYNFTHSSLSLPSPSNKKNSWQKLALFQFKLSLSIGRPTSCFSFPETIKWRMSIPKTMNWSMSYDHCTWAGITCNEFTGDVIGIDLSCSQLVGPILPNSTLFQLSSLQTVDLSHNDFSLSHQIPREFGRLARNLMHLNLSHCRFSGKIPSEIAHLHKLVSLRLPSYLSLEHKLFKLLLQNSTQLRELSLTGVDISSVLPTNLSSSLRILDIGSTGLHGELPEEIFHLPNLEMLRLAGNTNLSIKLPKVKWGSSSTLTRLSLAFTNLSGEIPDSMGYLRSISFLDLSGCKLSGLIPNVFANFKNLLVLNLRDNNWNGPFPSWIVGLRELIYLYLGENSLSGPLPSNLIPFGLQKLTTLSLNNNLLNGTIPSWLLSLPSLQFLYLSSNRLKGQLDEYQYSTSLTHLDLSSNNLSGVLEIDMFSCLKHLGFLDLSDNQILGQIPQLVGSTWEHSLRYVDLSHNLLTGGIELLQSKNLLYLNLKSNMLNGSLNWSICNSSSLEVLNLSNNNFSGVLPRCPSYISYSLSVLDLRMNNFQGKIPSTIPHFRNLRTLNLHGNQLEGTIPHSFANFKYLEVLDLGSNYMNGTFPNWLETLPNLQVLVLRSNRFDGPIRNNPNTIHPPFPSLRIIDLSHNEFSGLLPELYFKNFQAMINSDVKRIKLKYMGSDRYSDSVTIVIKGLEIEYVRILTVFTTIDLSSNNFEGKIPRCIGNLNSLLFLNLSHNGLIGHIPSELAGLLNLESLDISVNQLEGEIPQQLTRLGFLAYLNVSQNHLSGPIPQGKQFNTFENNSYSGNLALCGSPLSKECEKNKIGVEFDEEDDSDSVSTVFTWEAVLMGYGCGIVLGFTIGYLMFLVGKPKCFTGIVDRERRHWKVRG